MIFDFYAEEIHIHLFQITELNTQKCNISLI